MCAAASVSPSAPTPVTARIWSVAQLPASRLPPVQARKSAGRGKNPFLFAMLFEKNIEIFSDPNPSVLCVFSICLPPFRAWTSGAGREAGSWQKFAVETGITGARTSRDNYGNMSASLLGNVTQNTISVTWISAYTSGSISPYEFTSQQTMANETRPSNISVPVIVYLGLST